VRDGSATIYKTPRTPAFIVDAATGAASPTLALLPTAATVAGRVSTAPVMAVSALSVATASSQTRAKQVATSAQLLTLVQGEVVLRAQLAKCQTRPR
jgi:hypothetical protein